MKEDMEGLNTLSSQIIQAAIRVHRELGPGLLESVYLSAMSVELEAMGIRTQSEVRLPVIYRGQEISEDGLRIDLVVDGMIIVELKSVERIQPVHKKQLYTYMKLADKKLGLLINFNVPLLRKGICRIISSKKKISADSVCSSDPEP